MSCLDNIIGISCGDTRESSLSGLDLMDAPEINLTILANIASDEYRSGLKLAQDKVRLATVLIKNDLMSVMAANNVMPNINDANHITGDFRTQNPLAAEAGKERGVTLYRNSRIKGKLRKTIIHKVMVYPLADKEVAELKVYDDINGGIVTIYEVELIANQVNTFTLEYTVKGNFARVVLDGTDLPVSSAYITCMTGCHGSMPNDCGYAKSFYNGKELSGKEGYGIVLDFSCKCDYDELMCGLAKTFLGELVWIKSRGLLLEEHLRGNRLNNWIVYGREETQTYATDLENQYRTKWNTLAQSLPSVLKQWNDDCLSCRGTRWVTNI